MHLLTISYALFMLAAFEGPIVFLGYTGAIRDKKGTYIKIHMILATASVVLYAAFMLKHGYL